VLTPSQSPAYSETAVLTPTKAKSAAIALESPMVGVFYQSPSPDDPPFVSVGDFVRVGQPIGLIEAMKVYSEVPSEVAGRVTEMPVESGSLVQQGQPLIFVEPQ
jgi:acetyl-CoA carboxylase biotin carboxyl carrier protein